MLEQFYRFAAPVGTPVPTALSVAGVVYYDLVQTLPWYLALLAAISAFMGFESVGGLSTYVFVRSLRVKGQTFLLIAGFLGLATYFVAGLALLHTYAIMWFLPLTPFAYIAWAAVQDIQKAEQEASREAATTVEILTEERKLTNAQARLAKLAVSAGSTPQPAPQNPQKPPKIYPCADCDFVGQSQQSYAAHKRHCKRGVQ